MKKHYFFDFWKHKKTWTKNEYLDYLYYHGLITVHDYKLARLNGVNINKLLERKEH